MRSIVGLSVKHRVAFAGWWGFLDWKCDIFNKNYAETQACHSLVFILYTHCNH